MKKNNLKIINVCELKEGNLFQWNKQDDFQNLVLEVQELEFSNLIGIQYFCLNEKRKKENILYKETKILCQK